MKKRVIVLGITFLLLSLPIFSQFTITAQTYTWEIVEVFTGTGWLTTSTFTVTEDARFVWSTTYDDPAWADFHAYVFPEGEDILYETDFSGLEGTSYLYETGTFYIEVIEANTNSWRIEVQQKEFSTTPTSPSGTNGDIELELWEQIVYPIVFVGIIGAIVTYFVVRNRRKKSQPKPPMQPPVQPPEQMQAIRYCTQCGSANESTVKFCVNCGTSL